MESNYRKKLIRLLTFLGGIYFFLEFILPESALNSMGIGDKHTNISNGFITFGAMAVGLGIINLILVHGSRLLMVRRNWSYSLILLVGLFSMMTVATLDWIEGEQLTETAAKYGYLADFAQVISKDHQQQKEGVLPFFERTKYLERATREALDTLPRYLGSDADVIAHDRALFDSYKHKIIDHEKNAREHLEALVVEEIFQPERYETLHGDLVRIRSELQKLLFLKQKNSLVKKLYEFLYQGIFVSLGSAMFSLLAMYIAAAAYRAFRIKSFESALMMGAAIVVMLGQIPFYAYISTDLPFLRAWLLEVPNSAAFRAIKIGAAIAGLVMAFRMWFSIESESFSDEEQA